jgi:exosortase
MFWVMVAVPAILGWRAIAAVLSLAWSDEAYTHILLILPISIGLMYLDWPNKRTEPRPSWLHGGALLALAMAAAVIAKFNSPFSPDLQLSLYTLALILGWIGAFVGCFGIRLSQTFLFPLCFLFWLVPFPAVLLKAIVVGLQQGSASAAHLLFVAAGVPAVQDGIVLTIPGLTVEVAQECSSIRSSMMLLITTMVLAQLLLRSPWRKALADVLVIPLSLAKNGLRIFTIAMLGTRVDPAYLTGRLHHEGGVIFLIVALAAIFLLLWFLRDDNPAQQLVAPDAAAHK